MAKEIIEIDGKIFGVRNDDGEPVTIEQIGLHYGNEEQVCILDLINLEIHLIGEAISRGVFPQLAC